MRRKSIALLLALMMCLALLSACGADNTPDTVEPPASGDTSADQQPAGGKEEQPSQEPEQGEPTQEEPEEEEHAGTKLLALLQEEWNNGFVEGPNRSYSCNEYNANDKRAFIYNGVVYIRDMLGPITGTDTEAIKFSSYDITSKELRDAVSPDTPNTPGSKYSYSVYVGFLNGAFYYVNLLNQAATACDCTVYDCNGTSLRLYQHDGGISDYIFFEKGILVNGTVLLSHDLEKIADIPAPQREVAHGLKEDADLGNFTVAVADGTIYLLNRGENRSESFVLNTDTYEWEPGDIPPFSLDHVLDPFCGKYAVKGYCIYDRITGEEVFDCNEVGVYPPVSSNEYRNEYLSYFGGDKYLGFSDHNGKEYRWVNLKDLTMSDPLPFPEGLSSDKMIILNDTYCVYCDNYGWFLWNYNTGEEEAIMMFDQ